MSRGRTRAHSHSRSSRKEKAANNPVRNAREEKAVKNPVNTLTKILGIMLKTVIVLSAVFLVFIFLPIKEPNNTQAVVGKNINIDITPTITPTPPNERDIDEAWRENISKIEIENRLNVLWDDTNWKIRPFTAVPPGVNVMAPVWFKIVGVNGFASFEDVSYEAFEYMDICRAAGVKVWGTVQSLTPSLSKQFIQDGDMKEALFVFILNRIEVYGLDGINLDFENMDPDDRYKYNEFCRQLKARMPEGTTLSACVTVKLVPQNPDNWWQCYDREGLAKVVDYITVMTYDAHKNSTKVPVASINWVDMHIKRLLEEVPSEKLIMGIPFHGTDYRAKITDAGTLNTTPLWNDSGITATVYELNKLLTQGFYYRKSEDKTFTLDYWIDKGSWNSEYGISNYSFVDTDGVEHTIWIDDENSIYQKTRMADDYNLAGVAVWKRTLGTDPMFEAIARAMN